MSKSPLVIVVAALGLILAIENLQTLYDILFTVSIHCMVLEGTSERMVYNANIKFIERCVNACVHSRVSLIFDPNEATFGDEGPRQCCSKSSSI
jgi:hypothetical protein